MAASRKLAKKRAPAKKGAKAPSSARSKVEVATGPLSLRAFGSTDTGLVRSHNEDAFVVADLASDVVFTNAKSTSGRAGNDRSVKSAQLAAAVQMDIADGPGALLVVSDGMGGARAGEVASSIVIERVEATLRTLAKSVSPNAEPISDERLRALVQDASHAVRDGGRDPSRKGMGATLTLAWIGKRTALVAQVGDSRAYVLRGGNLRQITHDQSFVQMLVDAGALTPEAAELSPQKNVIMQVMGQDEELDVALVRVTLAPGDRLLLCSDGLSNMVPASDLAKLAGGSPIETACAALIDAAKRGGGEDNITVVLAEASVPVALASSGASGTSAGPAPAPPKQ